MATKVFTVAPEKLAIPFRSAEDGGLIIDPLGSRVNRCSADLFQP